jgi:hypothetical protein
VQVRRQQYSPHQRTSLPGRQHFPPAPRSVTNGCLVAKNGCGVAECGLARS